ncbi:putative DNA-binding transcriptional regulator [Lelliottia sp. V106_10]|uniref:YfeC-like transcriptional regulator n=1 Tax=Lelliottia wanjuensis TaxID=3050585 RepID=UPI00254AA7A7|nr:MULTISPECIES: YfeC-like transcriptional regulator [unclassified Lelliottia]MDK9358330.1 putative DNA-binding transcriptional regulator [Lelliottia sp. V106_16]MDK9376286.1 putative DNA-binding transcriptional regulator [Lelliottia sp. V106_10]MDK9603031.1 putative DNA-binding transcriptional regulator [Lelliottia sp. V106_5]
MKRLRSKMTTEELAESLGVAKQTVNRWIRKQGWKTEGLNGVKGGRARLIHIDTRVREHLMTLPAIRTRQAVYQLAEAAAEYGDVNTTSLPRQVTTALENLTQIEQQRLAVLLAREGVQGFLTRLGIAEEQT